MAKTTVRPSIKKGGNNKHCQKNAIHEEHILDIALNGKNYCSSINK
jgi:hypothetical protein